jgi:hypothetical protein
MDTNKGQKSAMWRGVRFQPGAGAEQSIYSRLRWLSRTRVSVACIWLHAS